MSFTSLWDDVWDQTNHALKTSATAGGAATPSSIGDGRKTVAAGGTAETLAGSTTCKSVVITGLRSNGDIVVVGGSTVVAASGTRRGKPLGPGESVAFDIDNLSKIYVDAVVSGEGVSYAYVN